MIILSSLCKGQKCSQIFHRWQKINLDVHQKNEIQNLRKRLARAGFTHFEATNSQSVGSSEPGGGESKAISFKETPRGISLRSAAPVTAGRRQHLIFHPREASLPDSSQSNTASFHLSLELLQCSKPAGWRDRELSN